MTWEMPPRSGPPWFTGFRSDKEYEAHAEEQEGQRRRQEDREKWSFDGFPTEEELAQAKERVERRWICVVEGHDWKTVGATPNGYQIEQCCRCDNVRFAVRDVSPTVKVNEVEPRRPGRIGP